jgi:squalene-associated FAD-dependent desaturase
MKLAVIGGGWAGCAAAIALGRHGHRITLYEAAADPGGRARTVQRDAMALDNGQHLLLGAYTATLALIGRLHRGGPAPLARTPLAMGPLAQDLPNALALRSRRLPMINALAGGLLFARGLSLRERLAAARAFRTWQRQRFRCAPLQTVSQMLAAHPPRVADELWAPLCIAALNTPPVRACAQVFLDVVAAAFDGGPHAADLLLPKSGLGPLLPEPAARWLDANGHCVRTRTTAVVHQAHHHGVQVDAQGVAERFDGAIVAVGPHQLRRALGPDVAQNASATAALDCVAAYRYEPITTIYLGYRGAVAALPPGLVRLDDAPGQWVFERDDIAASTGATARGLERILAVVISTAGAHDALAQGELAAACDAQLRRSLPALPPAAWSSVIAERRATYACTPGLAHPAIELGPRLFLAGDYLYPAFPATLEAAVRSGESAAAALDRALRGA